MQGLLKRFVYPINMVGLTGYCFRKLRIIKYNLVKINNIKNSHS
ncbi:MAG: hypothetical protein JWQ34_2225 [Mucilaginibacter sp.]|nr:hypothetical protein [Mucilaginibacter sp.]